MTKNGDEGSDSDDDEGEGSDSDDDEGESDDDDDDGSDTEAEIAMVKPMKAMKVKTKPKASKGNATTRKAEKGGTMKPNGKGGGMKDKKTKTIDWSDLVIWKKSWRKKTRGSWTSRAYDNARARAKAAGLKEVQAVKIAKEAYASAAQVWARHM